LIVLLALIVLTVAGGCSPYLDYYYAPRPFVAQVPSTQPSQPPPLDALVAVIGIRREDHKRSTPESVEVRLRLDNNGPEPVEFDPQSLSLSDAALVAFPAPILDIPEGLRLGPAESATVTALFPFPPGHSHHNTDLSALQVRWLVSIGGRTVGQVVRLQRIYAAYYGPYPYPYYYPYPWYGGWGCGVVVVRHR
jgi:hypothetical protein